LTAPVTFEDWERERIDHQIGVVATIGPNGVPHAAPVGVWLEGEILRFESLPDSRKVRNLAANPAVAVCVYGQPKWGVLVQGRAEIDFPTQQGEQAQVRVIPQRKTSWRRKEG
jgi:nitroimidazol reductase NimA-like FMN-containing flavoprotein (pyridoxamine 5'-phosphate oxidase superfamily)